MKTKHVRPQDYSYDSVVENLYKVRSIIHDGKSSQSVPNVILDLLSALSHIAVFPIEHDGVQYLKCAYEDLCNTGHIGDTA